MYASKKVENEGKGKTLFDIDIRSVIAMREISQRYSLLEKFCGFLNFLSPMQVGAFNETQNNITKAHVVATESMIAVVDQLKENLDDQGITDITVSCDGNCKLFLVTLINALIIELWQRLVRSASPRKVSKILKSMKNL